MSGPYPHRALVASGDDIAFMRTALSLGRRGLGNVWPNPAVGCVLVREGRIVGRGWTQPGGRPHAETEALRRAGDLARGATAYVTLEPCAHHGVTGPCADALIAAGITRAVIALQDPDPRVRGQGLARLRAGAIEVTEGVLGDEAADLNTGFLLRVSEGRPTFTLKLATSLDGRIAAGNGDSKWITGEPARRCAHLLRATHDAALVGAATVLADDPALTCRLPGHARCSPLRLVADSRLRLPAEAQVVRTARDLPTWVLTTAAADAVRREALQAAGVTVIEVAGGSEGVPDARAMARALAERGLTRVMIEGGGRLAASFLRAGLIDRLCWFTAPKIIGGDGIPAVAALGLDAVRAAPAFRLRQTCRLGTDIFCEYVR